MKENLPMHVWGSASTCGEPGQPATAKVNLMSKSQIASIFWDGYPWRHVWLIVSSTGTTTAICEPSFAPIASSKYGQNRSSLNLSCSIEKVGSLGVILCFPKLHKYFMKLHVIRPKWPCEMIFSWLWPSDDPQKHCQWLNRWNIVGRVQSVGRDQQVMKRTKNL